MTKTRAFDKLIILLARAKPASQDERHQDQFYALAFVHAVMEGRRALMSDNYPRMLNAVKELREVLPDVPV